MKIIPYGKQSIDKDDIGAVAKVLASPFLTQGPVGREFEKRLARFGGAKYAVAVSNGTAALHLAYLAAGLRQGDEVITTANTFVATTNMLLVMGVKPVFSDIRLDTYNLDENLIEKRINRKTKALVPVHFAGHPVEMNKILKIAKKHKLMVIEDACHALGASYKDRKIGSIGDMTVFSFHPVKSITTGEGGAILTNNKKLYDKLVFLRSHGVIKDKDGFNIMSGLGYNYRLSDIQAALGISQLKKLPTFIAKRQKVVSWYGEIFKDCEGFILPTATTAVQSAWHLYVVRVRSAKDRLPLYNFLKQNGIGVNFHYPPVYSHPFYKKLGLVGTDCQNTSNYGQTAITLPLYPELKLAEVKYVGAMVKKFFSDRDK